MEKFALNWKLTYFEHGRYHAIDNEYSFYEDKDLIGFIVH